MVFVCVKSIKVFNINKIYISCLDKIFEKRLNIQSIFNATSYLLGYEVNMLNCFLSHDKSFLINIGRDSK